MIYFYFMVPIRIVEDTPPTMKQNNEKVIGEPCMIGSVKKTINIKAYLFFKDFFLMLVCKTNLKMSVSGRPVRTLFRE